MIVNKKYCSSSYLMYRTIANHDYTFSEKIQPNFYTYNGVKDKIHSSLDLENSLKKQISEICLQKKTALALSGGIDSAILAKFMPKGSVVYTFKCVVPDVDVIDETTMAAKYAEENELVHKVVEIYWEDFEKYTPVLMQHKGAPIHSIEVQIYKAGLQALKDGHEAIIYGESCDLNYGGLSNLLSKNWTFGEFVDRYSYVKPYLVLKDFDLITDPFKNYEENGFINVHEFDRDFFLMEAMGSYSNACETAGIYLYAPYVNTWLDAPLDLERIRNGENKYLIRELFRKLYPDFPIPNKTPMPRPMDEWFKNWSGPVRNEFWQNCVKNLTGDQKYYVWALEKFLDIIDQK